ncbi:MAG: hypothetical protein L0Y44_00420 [Phycisphaerales bacterium]|nr:hypothetical protein [Phycisphaerales bacterium]MCI0629100.1 hypothetical protein [Phycisphaerales bacterium]
MKRMRLGVIALVMCGGLVGAGGCNVIGPAAYIIDGPPSTEARHELADVPTVVFIDDRSNVVNPISLRRVIADKASENLMIQEVLTKTISPQDAMVVAAQRERNSQILPIEEIGKFVGAKQVIYVEMAQFQTTADGYTPRPIASCRVRVIDVENRKRVFPPAESPVQAQVVNVAAREFSPELFRTRAGRLKVLEGLAIETGDRIAKLFYKHETKELGKNLVAP